MVIIYFHFTEGQTIGGMFSIIRFRLDLFYFYSDFHVKHFALQYFNV